MEENLPEDSLDKDGRQEQKGRVAGVGGRPGAKSGTDISPTVIKPIITLWSQY